MLSRLFLISLAMSSAACGDLSEFEDELAVDTTVVAADVAQPGPPAPPEPPAPAQGVVVRDEQNIDNGGFAFVYSWPEAVSAQAALAERFTAEREAMRASEREAWTKDVAEMPEDCVTCRSRSFEKTWQVVAQTPRWLSLSADIAVYTGGAHSNYGHAGMVWDKEVGVPHKVLDLFLSEAALDNAVGEAFCAEINEQRAKKRGAAVEAGSDAMFENCPGVGDLTVLLGSTDGEAFDRIGFLAAPYVAGPFSEGSYEVTVPVTTAVLDAVKPEYREAFALGPRN